jgi:cyclopropane-fatty-acyl-phospholipid synthase
LSRAKKVGIYRELLERCHRWLVPGGRVSLQMIAYGNSGPEDLDSFISERIFPESDLPRLSEVLEAAEGIFEPVSLRNDRRHYATTLRAWLANLRQNKERAIQEVGPEVFQDYDRYLRLCVYMFEGGGCDLHRIVLERINHPRKPIGGKGNR